MAPPSHIRFARWAAVSTKRQADEDKASIPNQLKHTLAAAKARGWVESAGPFVARGRSRTKYIELATAEAAIPELRLMMNAVRNRRVDVIVMTEADRLRGLIDQVRETCARYGVQLYSLAQPVEIDDPAHYDPYTSDAAAITFGMASIMSRAEISRQRRKWRDSIPLRVSEKGLPVQIVWGYRKPPGQEDSRKAVPEPDPNLTRYLLKMRDMVLEGKSLRAIADYLDAHHVPPPRSSRWHIGTIRLIVTNPFYAGWVTWGATRGYMDPQGKRRRTNAVPAAQVTRARGKHKPMWDDDTRQRIIAELHSRNRHYTGRKSRQFTGILKCGACGSPMWYRTQGPRADPVVWRCSKNPEHPPISHVKLIGLVASKLTAFYDPKKHKPQTEHAADERPSLDAARAEVEQQIERLEVAYLQQKFTLDRYALHKDRLAKQLAEIDDELTRIANADAARRARRGLFSKLTGTDVLNVLNHADTVTTNHMLRMLIKEIVAQDGCDVIIRYWE